MTSLQETLEKTLYAQLSQPQAMETVVAIAIRRKCPDLRADQATAVAKELVEHGTSTILLESLFPEEDRSVLISADELDAALKTHMKCVTKATSDAVRHVIDELAPSVVEEMKQKASDLTAQLAEDRRDFLGNLNLVWENSLNQLELMINAAHEANTFFLQSPTDQQRSKRSYRNFALSRVHLRACRTAHEILWLLRGGLADGASARWRSLHELSVVGMFLSEHGEKVARRYVDHQVIEQRKSLREYQRHHATLGQDAVEQKEADRIENEAIKMINRYGKSFGGDYGWAVPSLKGKPANFKEIEASLDLDHWRPYYLLACQSIHAGSRGCVYSLGAGNDPVIAYGPTIEGMQDPGSNCAQSLVLVSVAMLTSRPVLDNLLMAEVLSRMAGDVVDAFAISQQFLDDHLIELPDGFELPND